LRNFFHRPPSVDEMGSRIDDLEKSIGDLRAHHQARLRD
jgi:hypothetical protein